MATQFVSERALAETYDEGGWETVTQYREARRLREENPEMARAEIARRVGRPPSAVRGWLVEEKTPRVVAGLQTAQDRGWINVDTDSERFRALNQLVAWIFSGGGITARTDAFTPNFSVDDSLMLAFLSQQFRWLHLGYRCRDHADPDHRLEVFPSEGASVLGRVLVLLDAPRGVKAEQDDLTLPSYLSTVDREHRRDFARVYLLNRGANNPEQLGSYIQPIHSETLVHDVRDLFASVTTGSATVASHSRVWVSAAAVRDLAGFDIVSADTNDLDADAESDHPCGTATAAETPETIACDWDADQERARVRSGLATIALYGSLTPPTVRSIASTYRRSKTPGGYRYHRCYEAARNRDESRSTLATELGVSEAAIQSWRGGSRPYATNALEQARVRGWCDPDRETATALTGLLTWILARESIRESYYPVFGASTTDQRERFAALADTLSISYETVRPHDPEWPTEVRPTEDGSLLGRVLYALGAPRRVEPQQTASLPPLAYHYSHHAQQVAEIWCLHHSDRSVSAETTGTFSITVPPRVGDHLPSALATVFGDQLGWTIDRPESRKLIVTS